MKILDLNPDLTHEEQTMRDFRHEICDQQVQPFTICKKRKHVLLLKLPSDGEVNAHVRPELAALGSEVTTSGVSALENITCRDRE